MLNGRMLRRFALTGLLVPTVGVAGCICLPTYRNVATGAEAPIGAEQVCRQEARIMKDSNVDALPPESSTSQKTGAFLGNSIGNALKFRNELKACMERSGYARHY